MTETMLQGIPIFRIFDVETAREFYAGFLGFTVDWETRFEEGTPLYMQISRGRAGIEVAPWNAKVMEVIDLFGNRLRFNEDLPRG